MVFPILGVFSRTAVCRAELFELLFAAGNPLNDFVEHAVFVRPGVEIPAFARRDMDGKNLGAFQRFLAGFNLNVSPPFFLVVDSVVVRQQRPENAPVLRRDRLHHGAVLQIVHDGDRGPFGAVRQQFRHAEVIDVGSDRHAFGCSVVGGAENGGNHFCIGNSPLEAVVILLDDIGVSVIFSAGDVAEHLLKKGVAAFIVGEPVVFCGLLRRAESDQGTHEGDAHLHLCQEVCGMLELLLFRILPAGKGFKVSADAVCGIGDQDRARLDQVHLPDQVQRVLLPFRAGQRGGVDRGHDLDFSADDPLHVKKNQDSDDEDDDGHQTQDQGLAAFGAQSAPDVPGSVHSSFLRSCFRDSWRRNH